MATSDNPKRFHEMDGLRAGTMIVGIFFHAALSFMDSPIFSWPVQDRSHHWLVDLAVWAVRGFSMQVFFLVAGFFAHFLHHRYGPLGFIRHRLVRIVVPFVAGVLILVPIVHSLWIYGVYKSTILGANLTPWQAISDHFGSGEYIRKLGPVHLWFLYYLMFFYAGMMLGTAVMGRLVGRPALEQVDRAFRWIVRTPWKPVIMAVPTTVVFYQMKGPSMGDHPSFTFVPDLSLLLYYGMFFAFGCLLNRQAEILTCFMRYKWRYLACATLSVVTIPTLLSVQSYFDYPDHGWRKLAAVLCTATYSWMMIFGLMGIFVQYLNRPNALMRYISDSSYWLYLMHLPLVVYLQIVLADTAIPGIIKFFLINLVALTLLWLSYRYVVRYTLIGAILNGKRDRPTVNDRETLLKERSARA